MPLTMFASESYQTLVNIPGVNTDSDLDLDKYINALYALSIGIAGLLAVIKIVIAGVKWMMTDIVTSKGEAKKDIQGALIGLLVVLAAVLVITVINPQILDVNLNIERTSLANSAQTSDTDPSVNNIVTRCLISDYNTPLCSCPLDYNYVSREETQCSSGDETNSCYKLVCSPNNIKLLPGSHVSCSSATHCLNECKKINNAYVIIGVTYKGENYGDNKYQTSCGRAI